MAAKRGVGGSVRSGAKSSRRGRGTAGAWSARSVVAILLVGFVVVASIVILRRVIGVNQQTEIHKREQERDALDAERTRLEGEIRDASSRQRLEPIAEQRLHMHIATPQEQVILPPPARRGATTSRPSSPHDSL